LRDRRGHFSGQEPTTAADGASGLDLRAFARHRRALERRSNQTGLPDEMKERFEEQGEVDLSDVRVRRDSDQPKQITGTSFAAGDEIHLGPGQDANLGHEAWHLVQQRQGRVPATRHRDDGGAVNEDPALEREADEMGAGTAGPVAGAMSRGPAAAPTPVIQGGWVTVEETREKKNMETLSKSSHDGKQLYRDNQTGKVYVYVSSSSNGNVTVKEYQAPKNSSESKDDADSSDDDDGADGASSSSASSSSASSSSASNNSASSSSASNNSASNSSASNSSSSSSAAGRGMGDGVSAVYRGWSKDQTTQQDVATDYGTVSARHSRGAPYIQSRVDEWDGAKMGDKYSDFQRGLRDGDANDSSNDPQIAKDLLNGTDDHLQSWLQYRAAAMLSATVGVAEQWRKQGAVKIFRAALRMVIDGKITLDQVLDGTYFHFVNSADEGQQQVGAIQDVHESKDGKTGDEDDVNAALYANMSPLRDDDLSSDEDMRKRKAPALSTQKPKNRLYARKHQLKNEEEDEEMGGSDAEEEESAAGASSSSSSNVTQTSSTTTTTAASEQKADANDGKQVNTGADESASDADEEEEEEEAKPRKRKAAGSPSESKRKNKRKRR
jgi:Domain of unknown function (DUF4157)